MGGGLPLNSINLGVSAVIHHAGLHNRESHYESASSLKVWVQMKPVHLYDF